MSRRIVLGTLIVVLLSVPPTDAADHRNLEEDNPITIEDAFVIAYRSIEQQPVVRYERGGVRGEVFTLEPEIKWGFMKNAQLEIAAPFFIGPGDPEGSGNVRVESLYNFNLETQQVPAVALRAGVELPSGRNAAGMTGTVKGILTKGIARGRIHLNAAFTHVGATSEEERAARYQIVLGADHPADFGVLPIAVGLDNVVMMDVVVERAEREGGNPSWLAEAGLRHQVNPWMLLTLGAGVGLAGSAPDVQVTVGYQYTFAAF